MERAVRLSLEQKQAGPVHYLGVDEKTFCRAHDYMTIVYDLIGAIVE